MIEVKEQTVSRNYVHTLFAQVIPHASVHLIKAAPTVDQQHEEK